MRQTYRIQILPASIAVPDLDACFLERLRRCVPGNEPENFGDDGAKEDPLGGKQRQYEISV